MIIKAQDGTKHDIYTVQLEKNKIYCKDNSNRRKKVLLGTYLCGSAAAEIYREILNETSEYYEMPED